jgi:23S rRNA (cytidine1920-2'-O)/16S rRNA (cytidine1409-2'-O)-methyltransferase
MERQGAPKERIDALLVQKGFFPSREQAKRAIMAGLVFSPTERIDKPGTKVPIDLPLTVKGTPTPYVSRGGLKLEKAIQQFKLNIEGKVVLDVGASTGGFTDCALKHGARLVYAVDVGYGQLDWSLRNHPRVVVMERTNFRYAKVEDFTQDRPDFACIDVSFISLRLILPPLYAILKPESDAVALVKPQFEAGKDQVGKKGVVKDARIHEEVLWRVGQFARETGFRLNGLGYSPLTGAEGNIEFLLHLTSQPSSSARKNEWHDEQKWLSQIKQVVTEAHHVLSGNQNELK